MGHYNTLSHSWKFISHSASPFSRKNYQQASMSAKCLSLSLFHPIRKLYFYDAIFAQKSDCPILVVIVIRGLKFKKHLKKHSKTGFHEISKNIQAEARESGSYKRTGVKCVTQTMQQQTSDSFVWIPSK